jgi:hypothetical protein
MADSKFLSYQDQTGDGLIDVCGDEFVAEECLDCSECKPNLCAIVPNWRKRKVYEPFLNEKICKYQTTKITPYTTTRAPPNATDKEASAALKKIYDEYVDGALKILLDIYNKDNSDESIEIAKASVEYTDFHLDPRPKSRLKLLYSLPYHVLHGLPDRDSEEDAESEEDDIEVTYESSEMESKLLLIRKGLHLYSRHLKVYRAIENSNILFKEDDNVFDLNDYGDYGLFRGSIMARVLPELDDFLHQKGYNIPNAGKIGPFKERVSKITFTFDPEYQIKKLMVYSTACPNDPDIFVEGLNGLKNKSAWKDPTAMAYFASLADMETDLDTQVPLEWVEFIEKYTYPEVYSVTDYGYNDEAGGCIGEALKNERKQLGQDILDEVFSLGDAIAYKFHQINLCENDVEELQNTRIKMGLGSGIIYNPDAENTIMGMAKMQAYQTLKEENSLAAWLCSGLITGFGDNSGGFDFGEIRLVLDRAKICGILDLMLTSIECLFAGLSLEDALSAIIVSALNAMSIENFGKLFVGLPPEEQAALDAMVQEKLDSGELLGAGEAAETTGTSIMAAASGGYGEDIETLGAVSLTAYKPWEDEDIIEAEKQNMVEDSYTSMTPSQTESESQTTVRTLAPSLDESGDEDTPESATIMELYIAALIEYYTEVGLLELADLLSKFPGAEVIARILATINLFTCPVPPGPGWTFSSLLTDLGAGLPNPCPGCFNGNELVFPRFGAFQIPAWKDILKYLFNLIKKLIREALIRILMKLIAKICELIGDAICNALETVGDIAGSLPDLLTGKDNLKNLIRESICGPDADDEVLDDTIAEMFALFGAGGAAMADEQQTLSFAQDISSAVTQKELADAFLGNPSRGFLEIVDSLIEHEYGDFRAGLKNQTSIGSMFKNMGNLMPVEFRAQLGEVDMDEELPANPSLCATPEQLEQFCGLRSSLLAGRASKDQIEKLCDNRQSLDDLEDLSRIMQSIPNYLACNMPALQSDPGCDNGLLPYEPDEIALSTTIGLGKNLEALKSAFSIDMLGNGPGEKRWGMINMILSDTMGNPLTAHYRKAYNNRRYVDFYADSDAADAEAISLGAYPRIEAQRGAFPKKVAEWLSEYITTEVEPTFDSNNNYIGDQTYRKSFDDLGGNFGRVNLLSLPDLGYNVEIEVDYEAEEVLFVKKGRKETPDVTLYFEDNAKGLKSLGESEFSYGFELRMYLADLVENEEGTVQNQIGDTVRILITDKLNTTADTNVAAQSLVQNEDTKKKKKDPEIIKDRRYEFLAIDNVLEEIDAELADEYTDFLTTFQQKQEYLPQIVLLQEILSNAGSSVTAASIKSFYDGFLSSMLQTVMTDIAKNEAGFNYGAKYDGLTEDDIQYVTSDGGLYSKSDYSNDDMILGKSYNQYINELNGTPEDTRVFYLEPMTYGGNYMNPPIYIKPLKNEGWLGFVDVLFPELSPCKPQSSNLVDFGEIQGMITETYPSIPEDARLQEDPDCAVELPYNRILERSSTAAIEGLITAGIRIYASTHFIKSMATFTKFSPRFTEVFSSMYAYYIIEHMEESFKDAQPDFGERFSLFKDEEFWYAFLEQSVQLYARRVESGDITPPESALQAMIRLNDVQEEYTVPSKDDLRDAKQNDEISFIKTLKNYRSDKNLEAVKATEEDAKIILKELVIEQLNYMGEKFTENLKTIGMTPDVYDLDYYLLENFTQGSSLTIDKEIKPEYPDLPTEGDNHYTAGNELVVKEDTDGIGYQMGDEYIGYYHVQHDEDDNIMFMAGEVHSEEAHDLLYPMAHMTQLAIGDIEDYGTVAVTTSPTQPFVIEKYTKVNGTKMNPATATAAIKSNNNSLNISDIYPGNLELMEDDLGNVVGLEGELGARHGLQFSIVMGGTKYEITSVEVDAIDVTIGNYEAVPGGSKLLLCLINHLKDDDKFKLVARYIFPLSKLTALGAIYNDLAFLPSIGEVTVANKETFGFGSNPDDKPGVYVKSVPKGDTFTSEIDDDRGAEGWASVKDRSPGLFGGLFVREWDNWDQVLLRKTNRMLKKQFKPNYNSRDFNIADDGSRPAQDFLEDLKSKLKPSPGQRVLPRWRRRRLRPNPFNIKGELCEKED